LGFLASLFFVCKSGPIHYTVGFSFPRASTANTNHAKRNATVIRQFANRSNRFSCCLDIELSIASGCINVLPANFSALAVCRLAAAKRQGITLPVIDDVIAATVMERGLKLVTRNTKDYNGYGNLFFQPWDSP
jgi:hypothetical protein